MTMLATGFLLLFFTFVDLFHFELKRWVVQNLIVFMVGMGGVLAVVVVTIMVCIVSVMVENMKQDLKTTMRCHGRIQRHS